MPAERNKQAIIEKNDINTLPVDSIYTPVLKVNYNVESTRVGQAIDYDKLTIEVWTDGTINAQEAVSLAARVLTEHLNLFVNLSDEAAGAEIMVEKTNDDKEKALEMTIEELDLSVRSFNCLKRAGINTVEELQGKTVSIGEEESGTEQNAKQILAAYGLDEKLVKEVNLNYTDAAKQLQSGEIDALFCTSGVKTEMIEELANSCGIVLLPVDGSAATRLLAAYPAYSQGVIPAGSYNGQDQDVPTIGVKAVLLASDELSENTVKALTKTLYDGVDTLQAELGLPLELGPADKIGVPVHAGAAAYYQENGMAAGEDAA